MLDYYIGQVGILPDTFWKCTWNEAQLLAEAYHINQNLEWERMRYLSSMVYNTNATKKHQMIKPEKLFSLPQDRLKANGQPLKIPTPQDTFNFSQQVENRRNIKLWKMS